MSSLTLLQNITALPGFVLIPLSQGKYTLVDPEDFNYLNQWDWCYDSGYAQRTDRTNGVQKKIKMHRLINHTPQGWDTDHINGNKLDNRKVNLRTATRQLNIINSGNRKDNTSGYKGISWNKDKNKWVASLQINNKKIYLGKYFTIQEAVSARRSGERVYYGKIIAK